ncbi:MAG TPA: hypothetical protein VII73_09060 [Caulobacteraceae bacterium]
MRWLAPGADAARLLTRMPVECLTPSTDPNLAYEIELGRAAFRSPLLLGGQAARAGLACDSCHQNGRANANFDFPGLSGAPGTADVTSSLMSSHRGDGIDNPRPIPDLGGPRQAFKVSRVPGSSDLRLFIDGLITQEFDGAPPPPAVLSGLAAYVRALTPQACPGGAAWRVLSVDDAVADARRAVRTALGALARGDAPSAVVMIKAARAQLGNIAERYPGASLAPQRQGLAVADLDLAAALAAIRTGNAGAALRLSTWLGRSEGWAAPLRSAEGASLYAPEVLARTAGA